MNPIYSKHQFRRIIHGWNWYNSDDLCDLLIKGRNKSLILYVLNNFNSFINIDINLRIKYILHYGFDEQIKTGLINSKLSYIWFRHVNFISILKKIIKISPNCDSNHYTEFCEYILYRNFKMSRLFYLNNTKMYCSYGSDFGFDNYTLNIPDKEKKIIITCEENSRKNCRIELKEESFTLGDKLKYKISNMINLKFIGRNRYRLSEWFSYNNIGNRPIAREFLKIPF